MLLFLVGVAAAVIGIVMSVVVVDQNGSEHKVRTEVRARDVSK
jgi:hypothetical protein